MANSASEFLPSTLDRFEPVAVVRQFQVGRNGAITATKNDICDPKRLLFPEESFRFNGCAFHITFSRSEEHTSELQSHSDLVCRLLLEKKKEKDLRDEADAHIQGERGLLV